MIGLSVCTYDGYDAFHPPNPAGARGIQPCIQSNRTTLSMKPYRTQFLSLLLHLASQTAAFTAPRTCSLVSIWTNPSTAIFVQSNNNNPHVTKNNTSSNKTTAGSVPKMGWDKDPPKIALERIGKAHIATPWLLNIIEAQHWFGVLPAFGSAFAVMKYHDVWFHLFHGDALRVTLWLIAPMTAFVGGLAAIMAHIYEDWQIAPTTTKDPIDERENNGNDNSNNNYYDPNVYVNGRLREVSYGLLFTGLGISGIMNYIAFQGYSLTTVVPSLGFLMYGILGNKKHMVSDYLTPIFFKDEEYRIQVMPVSVPIMVFFVFSQIMVSLFVTAPLASLIIDNGNGLLLSLKMAMMLPQILFMAGGILEGCVAEVQFDQRLHLVSSACLSLGAVIQAWVYFQLGQCLP